jgi:hypothetical protein
MACSGAPTPSTDPAVSAGSGSTPPAAGATATSAGAPPTAAGGATTPSAGAASSAALPSGGGGAASGAAGEGSAGSQSVELLVGPAEGLWTAVRYYDSATPSNRTSGPKAAPEKVFNVRNAASAAVSLAVALVGRDAARFKLVSPANGKLDVPAGGQAEVRLSLTTANAELGPAPAQNDGATVLSASLELTAESRKIAIRNYALVLTYAELEPTFGQILRAFPHWTSKLPSWLPDNANPNPGKLPGVVAGTDEVAANAFERLDASKPVTLRAIARFSPPGLVPFGWYEPAKPANRITVATLAEQPDAQTNDKSRLLEPPLGSGALLFEPTTSKFGIWMMPAGVGLLASEDSASFDGQHRVRAWTLRDAQGAVLPGTFLLGGEEANNGDYQDYVFVLGNVKPALP